MKRHNNFLVILLTCFCLSLPSIGTTNATEAEIELIKAVPQKVQGNVHGMVTEVIDAAGYTYAEIDTGQEKVWAAGPPTALKKGDMISFSPQMPMQNFHSKSLGRDFPVIYFISNYITDDKKTVNAAAHGQLKQQAGEPVKGIEKVKNGKTIAEIYSDKNNLKDKSVRVRGKVTKFTPNILGKNWVHIKDSSTAEDLTVTTTDIVTVDDVVICEGTLELDKDYNYGYLYPVIMESAKVTKE